MPALQLFAVGRLYASNATFHQTNILLRNCGGRARRYDGAVSQLGTLLSEIAQRHGRADGDILRLLSLRSGALTAVNDRPGVVERAFQVAQSGKVGNIKDVQAQLAEEGYSNVTVVLAGRSLRQQISRMIIDAMAASK